MSLPSDYSENSDLPAQSGSNFLHSSKLHVGNRSSETSPLPLSRNPICIQDTQIPGRHAISILLSQQGQPSSLWTKRLEHYSHPICLICRCKRNIRHPPGPRVAFERDWTESQVFLRFATIYKSKIFTVMPLRAKSRATTPAFRHIPESHPARI